MKRTIVIWTALGVAFLALSDRARTARSANQDAASQVLEATAKFQRAGTNKSYAGELRSVFDEKITHFHPGGPYRLTGRDRLVAEFEGALNRQENIHFEMVEPIVQMIGDQAAVLTYYVNENWTEKGAHHSVTEKATEVWVKKGDRNWVMIHNHYSANP